MASSSRGDFPISTTWTQGISKPSNIQFGSNNYGIEPAQVDWFFGASGGPTIKDAAMSVGGSTTITTLWQKIKNSVIAVAGLATAVIQAVKMKLGVMGVLGAAIVTMVAIRAKVASFFTEGASSVTVSFVKRKIFGGNVSGTTEVTMVAEELGVGGGDPIIIFNMRTIQSISRTVR